MNTTTRRSGMQGQRPRSREAAAVGGRETGASATTMTDVVSPECIRARAYEIYRVRSGSGRAGDAISDWLQAERELNGWAPDPSASADIEIKAQIRGERLLASGE